MIQYEGASECVEEFALHSALSIGSCQDMSDGCPKVQIHVG